MKTWLLQELKRRIQLLLPGLIVFYGEGDEVLRQLYRGKCACVCARASLCVCARACM